MTVSALWLISLLPIWAAAVWWMAETHRRTRARVTEVYVDYLIAASRTPKER